MEEDFTTAQMIQFAKFCQTKNYIPNENVLQLWKDTIRTEHLKILNIKMYKR